MKAALRDLARPMNPELSPRGVRAAQPDQSAWWRRPIGDGRWDVLVRGSGLAGLIAIPLVALVPAAAGLVVFVLVTVWVHGPLSPFLPAAYEPTLMLYGRLYSPLVVAAFGTMGNLATEYLNYHLYGRVLRLGPLRRVPASRPIRRLLALFERSPGLAVWIGAWSPIPDWVVRGLAPLAGYPVSRYLLAMGLGRLPRYWFFAALGRTWGVPDGLFLLAITVSAVAGGGALAWRATRSWRRPPALAQPLLDSTGGAVC